MVPAAPGNIPYSWLASRQEPRALVPPGDTACYLVTVITVARTTVRWTSKDLYNFCLFGLNARSSAGFANLHDLKVPTDHSSGNPALAGWERFNSRAAGWTDHVTCMVQGMLFECVADEASPERRH